MDRLRKSFRSSFRKKSEQEDINIRTVTWPKDEAAVKTNTCSFEVKYLGAVEVFESRGMQVCEEALKLLKNSKRRIIRGTLHVSGDGLRVVDKDTKGLVLDQTIEKVSFCAPDRSYEKGFSYICRDGTTRRWMCHGFLAVGDSGERLSHAVGCAFAICLEKKQLREKESVQYHYNKKENVFTRFGSFQQGSIHDRLKDPQEFKPGLQPPKQTECVENPHAVARPRASDMYLRQASMRGCPSTSANSLFKRQYSLRLNELPSTLSRQTSGDLFRDVTEASRCSTIQEDVTNSPSRQFSSMITSTPGPPPTGLPAMGVSALSPLSPSFGSESGPVSLPADLSGVTPLSPLSVLTEDIPEHVPPPVLSPTLGGLVSPASGASGSPSSRPSTTKTSPSLQNKNSSEVSVPRSAFNPFTSSEAIGQCPVIKMGAAPPPVLPPRSSNPPPLPNRSHAPSVTLSPTPDLKSNSSAQGSEWSLMQDAKPTLEPFNPWDNVPDQPVVRLGGQKSVRPVSMIECDTFSKPTSQTTGMERGHSLEASMNSEAQSKDKHNYNNLFSVKADSDASSGFLQDPFDSDWAELALKTKAKSHFQDKNDNTFKSFELHL